MKKYILLLTCIVIVLCSFKSKRTNYDKTVNSVIGDVSFIEKFGHAPNQSTDENLRLRTHLEYVENTLRKSDKQQNLSPERIRNREHLLDLLHAYWTVGSFPHNYDHPGKRLPCFIDRDGNICAVGYLIEKTSGRYVAEQINKRHQYKKITDMDDPLVKEWISQSGLTEEECAMIQPQYNYNHNTATDDQISPVMGVGSLILGSGNIALSIINGNQASKGAKNNNAAILGVVLGAAEVVLGAANLQHESGGEVNNDLRTLSTVNIVVGSVGTIFGTWNLLNKKTPENKSTSWNVFPFPIDAQHAGVGFSFVKKF